VELRAAGNRKLHRHWMLGGDEHTIATTEFEWAIMRLQAAFERSCVQLANLAGRETLSFQELLLLHVVAMQHHPQTSQSLARQLNRDDVPNMQYTLRKLQEQELVQKRREPRGRTYTYEVTDSGREFVERYAEVRSLLLTGKTKFIDDIDERLSAANDLISLLTGVYDDVARVSSTYSPLDPD
jgi:predicted MarR family transcription regulator